MRKLKKEWVQLQHEYAIVHRLFEKWLSRPDHRMSAEIKQRCSDLQDRLSQFKDKVNYQYRDLVSQHAHEEEI
jgi:hypothetical protein